MSRFLPIFVVLATVSALPATQSSTSNTVTEPRSGTPFPVSIIPPGGTTPHWIMGTGLRDRTIFRVQIYAFGLYVDPNGARAALSPFARIPASTFERDETFYRRLLDLDFAMTLRLVMIRTIDGDDAAEAFDDALRPRMARAMRGATGSAAEAALESFGRHFDVDKVQTGTEIVFSCNPEGRLTTSVEGGERPRIDSAALCRALFDVYLGEAPISGTGKRRVIAGFPGLLARSTVP